MHVRLRSRLARPALVLAAVATAGVTVAAVALPAATTASAAAHPGARSAPAGRSGAPTARPVSLIKPAHARGSARPPTNAQCEKDYGIHCYTPSQLEAAYNLKPLYTKGDTGAGETIAVVDSFGAPDIQASLNTFDTDFGLPAGIVTVLRPDKTKVPAYNPKNASMAGWAQETDLDVEYAHAMAPGARILLVETPVSETEGIVGFPQIINAERYVVNHRLADVISQSFGASERTFGSGKELQSLRGAIKDAYNHKVTVLASSGDSGADDVCNQAGTLYCLVRTQSWPSSDPLVTSVGGLQYFLNAAGGQVRVAQVWNNQALLHSPAAGGGGTSIYFGRPSWQRLVARVVGTHRGTPDISLSAAVNGAAIVYCGPGVLSPKSKGGFAPFGGTSEASPSFSGVVAIADQVAGHDLGLINPALYALAAGAAPGIVDITHGNNTVAFTQHGKRYTVVGYKAVAGYDLASGLGAVNGAKLVPELVAEEKALTARRHHVG